MPTILLVDDEPTIRYLLRASLEGRGYRLLEADDGLSALESAQSELPDLILLDIALPGLSGLEVAQREPRVALDGGLGGLTLIRAALLNLPRHLKSGGLALFEIDPRQSQTVAEQAQSHLPSSVIQIYRDLSGRERLVAIRNA